ncbi:MAG: hypothetical protein IPK19_25455 [Chloroflexi bacterium]|nr:hypothetical protein [Chloroflexota bacterium]
MSFTAAKHPELPAVIVTLNADYDLPKEMESTTQAVAAILEKAKEPLVLVNVLKVLLSLDDILTAASGVGRGLGAAWHHPNIMKVFVVTDDPLLLAASKGMASDAFGNLNIAMAPTLEEALASIK